MEMILVELHLLQWLRRRIFRRRRYLTVLFTTQAIPHHSLIAHPSTRAAQPTPSLSRTWLLISPDRQRSTLPSTGMAGDDPEISSPSFDSFLAVGAFGLLRDHLLPLFLPSHFPRIDLIDLPCNSRTNQKPHSRTSGRLPGIHGCARVLPSRPLNLAKRSIRSSAANNICPLHAPWLLQQSPQKRPSTSTTWPSKRRTSTSSTMSTIT